MTILKKIFNSILYIAATISLFATYAFSIDNLTSTPSDEVPFFALAVTILTIFIYIKVIKRK